MSAIEPYFVSRPSLVCLTDGRGECYRTNNSSLRAHGGDGTKGSGHEILKHSVVCFAALGSIGTKVGDLGGIAIRGRIEPTLAGSCESRRGAYGGQLLAGAAAEGGTRLGRDGRHPETGREASSDVRGRN
jgi:hypothetical protein